MRFVIPFFCPSRFGKDLMLYYYYYFAEIIHSIRGSQSQQLFPGHNTPSGWPEQCFRASSDNECKEMKPHAFYSSSKPALKQGTFVSTGQIRKKVKAQGHGGNGQSGRLEGRAQQSLQQCASSQHSAQYGSCCDSSLCVSFQKVCL